MAEFSQIYASRRASRKPSHLSGLPGVSSAFFPRRSAGLIFDPRAQKGLMPQLQTKVSTLRRWGRKMTVVVDRPFFDSLGTMISIAHLSNADIAWFVVDYDPDSGAMSLTERVFTTLESSVEALTAGVPMSRDAFEEEANANNNLTRKEYEAQSD
jgi:Restriction endonuclease NotI